MTDHSALLQIAHGALSPRRVDTILDRYGSAEAVVRAARRMDPWLGKRAGEIAVGGSERSEQLAALGVEFIADPAAPELSRLNRYPGAPRFLFRRGASVDLCNPTLSIIGSRSSTAYGLELAYAYGRLAARSGWTIVSGLARGIDGSAHRGALASGGTCVGVLGSGIDTVYPREHGLLFDEIAESGCLLSEYPPGTRPDAWRFPTRNRIIAGLSDVVLVVEASETGGALITAQIAIDYGIAVFATPGDIDRVTSKGTNALIRDGAFPVFDADDLATVLSLVAETLHHKPSAPVQTAAEVGER